MKVPGVGRAKRAFRRFGAGWVSSRVILVYHRIADIDSDPWDLCVSPDRFAEHLDVLRRHAACMTLQKLVREGDILPRRTVVVTFDDGYADNLHQAKPLLERYDVPATIFLSTGYLGGQREFWWDELERLLLQPGTLPLVIDLTIDGTVYRWRLEQAARYTEEAFRRHRAWKAGEQPPTERQSLYGELWRLLQAPRASEQRRVLDELASWAGLTPKARPTHRVLSIDEAATLGVDGLIEIGAHTVTHPALPALPLASQRDEIRRSKVDCEAISGRPVTSFSHPFSASTPATRSLVGEAGFECACATVGDVVRRDTDRFRLPRLPVMDWNGDEFAQQLVKWFAL